MLELLVAGLCLGEYECPTAFKAYYAQRPLLKQQVKEVRRDVEQVAGRTFFSIIAPVGIIASGHPASLRLSKTWSVKVDEDKVAAVWGMTF